MNNETLNRLNAFVADYKKESEEKDAIIKKQNQMLLRISAELEAIKQCDPFNSVFIAGSIENISNVIKGETDPIFDEGCIGCAGPCMVVDVVAKLQKELDECRKYLPDNFWAVVGRKNATISQQKNTIEDLKDSNIEDLKELYDIYEKALRSAKSDYEIMRTNHLNTVDKLQGDIKGLEAELSARKEDSEVLMEVVDVIRDDTIPNSKVPCLICNLVDDYLDASEGHKTPIDDLYKTTVSIFLEMP